MITITEQPPSIPTLLTDPKAPPVPVSECWKWCLLPDPSDAIGTTGARGTVVVTFPETTTVPSDGAAFKIWGYDFTVQSSEPFTSESYKAETVGLATTLNFVAMIQANLFFNRAVSIAVDIDGSNFVVTLTWNECREQPRFSVDDMDFDPGITGTGGSGVATNGISPEYIEGFEIISRVGYYGTTGAFLPISRFVGIQPDKQCDTVGQICPEYMRDVETQLYTDMPDLTSTSFITAVQGGNSLMRLFQIEYGWVYREDCVGKSGTIKKSEFVLGINAAFDINDPYGIRRYWYDHPDGFPPDQSVPDFLTTQPKSIPLCWGSFKWLWLLNNWQTEFGAYKLVARFVLYKKGVGVFEFISHEIDDPSLSGSSWKTPINFNVSPKFVLDNAPTLTEADLDFYEVQVIGTDPGTGDPLFNASEYLRFVPGHCCDGTTDIYFLTPAGGIGTLVVRIDERSVVQDGQEVNLQIACGTSRLDKARYGGRTMVNLRSYEQIKFTVFASNNLEWQRWLKHFRASPQHWIRVEDELGGSPFARKLLLEPGSGTIFKTGEGIEFTTTGYLTDISTQKGTEP